MQPLIPDAEFATAVAVKIQAWNTRTHRWETIDLDTTTGTINADVFCDNFADQGGWKPYRLVTLDADHNEIAEQVVTTGLVPNPDVTSAIEWADALDVVTMAYESIGSLVSHAYADGHAAGVRIDTDADDNYGRQLTSADGAWVINYNEAARYWVDGPR